MSDEETKPIENPGKLATLTRSACGYLVNIVLAAPEAELQIDQLAAAGALMAKIKQARGQEPIFHAPETDDKELFLMAQSRFNASNAKWIREESTPFEITSRDKSLVDKIVRKLWETKEFRKKYGASVELYQIMEAFGVGA